MGTFEDLIGLIAGLIGLVALIVVLTIIQGILQIPVWVLSLNIPDPIKTWVLENTFAFILIIIGIPALIVAKITKMW